MNLAYGAAYVRTNEPNARWEIGNDDVARTLSITASGGLETVSLTNKRTQRDLTEYGRERKRIGDEFSFKANGKTITGKSIEFVKAETVEIPGGKALKLSLRSKSGGVGIDVVYAAYDDFPALRKWIVIKNEQTNPIVVTNVTFESLSAGPGTPAELTVSGGYGGAFRDFFYTGRVADNAVLIRNAKTGEGMAIINEAPGYTKRTEIGEGWSDEFHVMYDTDLFPFEKTLAPGATFETAKCSLVFFRDGAGFEDSHWAVPGYAAAILMRRADKTGTPWVFNTWEPFLRNINEKTTRELAEAAHQAGIDIFTIDDGWQADYGANDVDKERFPGGFPSIDQIMKDNGLKLGLWVPLAAISTKTPEYKQHPDWVCRDRDGKPKFTSTASGQSAVMCLGSGYRDVALARLTDLIERYHPAYIKVDLTTVFNAYGEQPGCNAKGHYHHDWAESLESIYEGLEYIGTELYRRHPEVLVDYTFELWGEKHLIDAALTQVADLDWLSNAYDGIPEAGGPRHARQLLYDRAFSIPAETMLIGNLRANIGSIEEHFATAIGAAPLLLGDLRALTPEQRAWYRDRISSYKKLRSSSNLLDSFFPLGSWRQVNEASWDGFARLSKDGDGIVALFLNDSGARSVDFQVIAPPHAEYHVRSMLTNREVGTVNANELAAGWHVELPAATKVEVLELIRKK
jgi:alpha-galactosidase